ncbi:hypothetical protein ILUMI_01342 [Ignelater luminosus]|uniref:Ubiquitin-like domain-containing protein n=1 Tax=Ignelater luminosus TaxID=2038154 RepID=A0A8K0DK74_IGNLU|nr:hypothetical protein ILUMI_01342 [Ignelater luminosus]
MSNCQSVVTKSVANGNDNYEENYKIVCVSLMLSIGFVIKMLMSADFGDKVIQVLIALIIIVIVCFAWWTTNTTEQPHYRTVFLLERRLRRRTSRTRLTTHIQSTSIGGTQTEEASAAAGDTQSNPTTSSPEENKPPEASTSTASSGEQTNSDQNTPRSIEDEELETIVQIMDADANVVRLRRLAYYENQQPGDTNTNQATTSENSQSSNSASSTAEDSSSEPRDVHEPIMEHNYAERETVHVNSSENIESTSSKANTENSDSNIRIKLKYLNDELKLVDGRLEEQLGDFKRRHFQLEFSSNKLVRLIFNGQVLQPDTETLQNCGLFDNCVVHCLIHQQRNTFSDTNNSGSSFTTGTNARSGNASGLPSNNNNNTGRDWDLGNVLFAFVSIILGSAWYFRYEYAHLYTVTATVALVAITGIFTIFLVGVYFPDPQPPQPRVEQHSIPT